MVWKILIAIAVVIAVPLLLWGLHRFAIALEDAGYIYYRTKKEGGNGGLHGAFNQMDHLIRPSVEHTRETEEVSQIVRDDVGGE